MWNILRLVVKTSSLCHEATHKKDSTQYRATKYGFTFGFSYSSHLSTAKEGEESSEGSDESASGSASRSEDTQTKEIAESSEILPTSQDNTKDEAARAQNGVQTWRCWCFPRMKKVFDRNASLSGREYQTALYSRNHKSELRFLQWYQIFRKPSPNIGSSGWMPHSAPTLQPLYASSTFHIM